MLSSVLKAAALALAVTPVSAIWPIPKTISTGNSTLFIDQTVAVTYNGKPVRKSHPDSHFLYQAAKDSIYAQLTYAVGYTPPPGPNFKSSDIVQGGVERAFSAIFQDGLVPWMLRERGSDFEPKQRDDTKRVAKLTITQTEEDDENTFKPVAGTLDESYSLKVGLDGEATLNAASSIGVLRGLETLSQLFYKHSSGLTFYTQHAPYDIEDEPLYPHRGILMDVSRHWFPLEDIKRQIDGLAMNKMNVLHLHMTDTQSWPLEVPSLPKLTEKGAYAPHLTFTPADIQDLYEYGVHRGVQVIMEIDMPGHVGIDQAYPGLTVAFNKQPYQWYCAQPPCGSFKLNSTDVEDFLDTLLDDVLARISPYTAYFHTGGDEYKANNSLLDPALETNDVQTLQPMLQRFLTHVHDKVVEHGLAPMVWEEMVLEWNATVPEGTVIQSWLGQGAVKELAEDGHKVIDSSYNFYYLDCGRGQWLDFPNGESWQTFYPFTDWCQPTKSWRLIYSHDPRDGVADEAKDNVIGGECPVWSETIDPATLDGLVWPRAGVAGEVWWSGNVDAQGNNRTHYEVRPRLSEQRERMLTRGVKGSVITQQWCDMNKPEDCGHEMQ
ncbi:hexosaminidase [Emericellopsis cladophorae]|uniref:Beta-hexosaminidase n=1 Tax=Emericellopsis cladophorae TaxID=2686198 RepID=A0A9P9Y7Y5_9HYPO|nr:hexosaminidase [Emericellopsis cladophorae]KAI6784635.1 hexosaminidase [Emericellopsis cladophorae]